MPACAYGLLSCASADLLHRATGCCLRRDQNGTIEGRRMIGHPSPRLTPVLSKLWPGLLAIPTCQAGRWPSSPVEGQCFRRSWHNCRC